MFEHDSYPFFKDLPYSGQEFQDHLDGIWVVGGYHKCFEAFKGRHTEWQNIVQAGAFNEGHPRRRPTEWEIRVQAFLALSRGAKGIGYFPYFSGGDPPGYFYHGLVSEETPRQPVPYYFDYVARLNQDLRVIGPIMRRLECTAAFDTSNIPPDSYIKSVIGSNYIEVGTFVDFRGTDYFMLVNRHCLPEDTVTLTVEIEKEGTWFCRDMLTGEDTVLVSDPTGRFYYTKVVGPGDGCLVLLKKAKYGVIAKDIWYEYEYIAGDVTVPDGGFVIVEPGTLVKAVAGYDNQCHGVDSTLSEVIVEGTFYADAGWVAGADTIVFTSSADTAQPSDWYGIRFRPNSSGSIRECVIEYGYTALEAVGADLSPIRQNSIRSNAYAGILVSGCSPLIDYNQISSNQVYGIFTDFSNSPVTGNILDNNRTYGIVSRSSSGLISKNRVTMASIVQSDWGIVVKYPIGPTYLVGNYVSGYTQGGIGCDRFLDGEVTGDTISSVRYYGLHFSDRCKPVVGQCRITGHDFGVYCRYNSYPVLGLLSGAGFDTTGGRNSIYDSREYHVANLNIDDTGDSIKAEVNWWGASPPDPLKFLGLVDYKPWLEEEPDGDGGGAQSAEDRFLMPATYGLSAFPNPCVSATVIRFQLPQACQTTLKVYDIAGRLVKTLVDEKKKAGYYQSVWEGEDESGVRTGSGVYFYRMCAKKLDGSESDGEVSEYKVSKKLIVLR